MEVLEVAVAVVGAVDVPLERGLHAGDDVLLHAPRLLLLHRAARGATRATRGRAGGAFSAPGKGKAAAAEMRGAGRGEARREGRAASAGADAECAVDIGRGDDSGGGAGRRRRRGAAREGLREGRMPREVLGQVSG